MNRDPKKIIYLLAGAVIFLLGLVAGLSVMIFTKDHSNSFDGNIPAPMTGNIPMNSAINPGQPSQKAPANIPLPKSLEKYAKFPTSWMSDKLDSSKKQGYALFLDLASSKKMIFERCTALVYLDPKTKQPVSPHPAEGNDFCVPVVWNEIIDMDDNTIFVKDKEKGTKLSIPFKISANSARIKVNGVEINLIPGSRNDLLQKIEALDSVRREKDEALKKMKPEDRAR